MSPTPGPGASFYERLTLDWSDEDRDRLPESEVHHHDCLSSSNTELLERYRRGQGGPIQLVVADHQTAGRGRRGDRWEAPAGTNLLFSLGLPLSGRPDTWSWLPHFAARVVGDVVESVMTTATKVQAKWPNDLLVDGKKICGILVETTAHPEPRAVIGIGLNVNARSGQFPPELREAATSLYEIEGCESSRSFLLGLIVRDILRSYPETLTEPESIASWYRERDYLAGREIEVTTVDGAHRGIGSGLGERGDLLLSCDGQTHSIVTAEKIMFC